jgi:hypothetical protein
MYDSIISLVTELGRDPIPCYRPIYDTQQKMKAISRLCGKANDTMGGNGHSMRSIGNGADQS